MQKLVVTFFFSFYIIKILQNEKKVTTFFLHGSIFFTSNKTPIRCFVPLFAALFPYSIFQLLAAPYWQGKLRVANSLWSKVGAGRLWRTRKGFSKCWRKISRSLPPGIMTQYTYRKDCSSGRRVSGRSSSSCVYVNEWEWTLTNEGTNEHVKTHLAGSVGIFTRRHVHSEVFLFSSNSQYKRNHHGHV